MVTKNNLTDTITGTFGDDTLNGGFDTGSHTLIGMAGNDVYYVYNPADIVIENANEGNDSIFSYISYMLSSNVENLTLLGSDNIDGTGNNLSDQIIGNSGNNLLTGGIGNDTLDGGPGADTMIGDRGNDVYYIDSSDDVIIENASGGTDTVYSSITYYMPDYVERLFFTLLGDKDGYGNSLDNYINGNCFANYIDGDAGDDTIYGSLGNDTLNGNSGTDKMFGGMGDDFFYVDNTGDAVIEYSEQGTDTVISTISYTLPNSVENLILAGDNTINCYGNYLDNDILGNSANNILRGLAGNDTIDGGMGADSMLGSIGDDVYFVDNAGDIVIESPDQGNDTVLSSISYIISDNVENLVLLNEDNINGIGNNLDNYITGNVGDNLLSGNGGNDVLDGGTGSDILIGGAGNDTFIFDKGYGNDTIQDSENIDSVKFGDKIALSDLGIFRDGNDLYIDIKNSSDNLMIQNWFLGDQNKIGTFVFKDGTVLTPQDIANIMLHQHGMPLNGNIDNMIGTSENDVFFVDNVNDSVTEYSNGGLDEVRSLITYDLTSNVENLTLIGSDNINGTGNNLNNNILGNSGDNLISGGAGNDTIDGSSGIDTLVGGYGNDNYYIDNQNDIVIEYANQGIDMVFTSVSYTLSDYIEKLDLLGTENIDGYGNDLTNIMWGNNGDNLLNGMRGDDTIYGYDGNDTLYGGVGIDKMFGNTGDDTYYIDNAEDAVIEYSNQGTDEVRSAISYTLGNNVENLILLDNSNLSGAGNGLNNVITGNSGNNNLYGGAGNDTILGGAGNDTLDGASGCDSLIGGTGNDLLKGGSNEDTYDGYETAGFGMDTIYDTSGTEDRLELGNYDSSVPVITAVDLDHNGRVDGLLISFNDNDSILIQNYFGNTKADPHLSNTGYGLLETIHFSNGDYHFQDIQSLI